MEDQNSNSVYGVSSRVLKEFDSRRFRGLPALLEKCDQYIGVLAFTLKKKQIVKNNYEDYDNLAS